MKHLLFPLAGYRVFSRRASNLQTALSNDPELMKSILSSILITALVCVSAHAQDINKPAPAFTAKTAVGETVSLSDLKGKVVVLEWTNYDCPFVLKHYTGGSTPKLQAEAAAKGVVWLSVNSSAPGKQGHFEPQALVAKAAERGAKPTHLILDANAKIGRAYDAKVTPQMFIINAEGIIVYNGAIDSKPSTDAADIATAEPLFSNALTAVLEGKPVVNGKNEPYGCTVKY